MISRMSILVGGLVTATAVSRAAAQRSGAPYCASAPGRLRLLPNVVIRSGLVEADTVVHTLCDVDQPAIIHPSPKPVYPGPLASADVDGRVLLSFVVLADGRIDTSSVQVLLATHELFTKEVRHAVASWKAEPASYRSLPVKQLVEYEFQFESRCSGADPDVRPPSSEGPVSGSVRICAPR